MRVIRIIFSTLAAFTSSIVFLNVRFLQNRIRVTDTGGLVDVTTTNNGAGGISAPAFPHRRSLRTYESTVPTHSSPTESITKEVEEAAVTPTKASLRAANEYLHQHAKVDAKPSKRRPFDDGPPPKSVKEALNRVIQDSVASEMADDDEVGSKSKKSHDSVDTNQPQHKVAGLDCSRYGGPSPEIASEMVYWEDVPTDSSFASPFASTTDGETRYLTFEPDEGGWNNVRMAMETAVTMAAVMGRTLVLPPTQRIYLLQNDKKKWKNNHFTFKDFFHFDSIASEHLNSVKIISMKEFLKREAITGQLRNETTGDVYYPPNNETKWNGVSREKARKLWLWLREAATTPKWNPEQGVLAIPSKAGVEYSDEFKTTLRHDMKHDKLTVGNWKQYIDNPTDVDAPHQQRLKEMLIGSGRRQVYTYGDKVQNSKVLHLMGDHRSGARMLVHFYEFLHFENYHHDLWSKRFVRDHLRYIDQIQCVAAKIVQAMKEKAIENGNGNGDFDTFHIRRGDFQYVEQTRVEATTIYNNVNDVIPEKATVFIATDERNKTFFEPLEDHYDSYYLGDFEHLLEGVNPNYYGMIDQLVASKGRTFVGAFYSTFTGYINRLRGYHSQKQRAQGYEHGEINSYYYIPMGNKYELRKYYPIKGELWSREFPVAWRDIDHDLES